MSEEEQRKEQKDNLLVKLGKQRTQKAVGKALSKAGKAAAKAVAKATAVGIKAVIGLLAGLGLPFILTIGAIIFSLFAIYLATTLFFTSGDKDGMSKAEKKLYEHVVELSEKSVDMSKKEQIPYKVPVELIFAALQIYESEERDQTSKEAATIVAEALSPTFEYEEMDVVIEHYEKVCKAKECEEKKTEDIHPMKPLKRVESWDKTITFDNTKYTSDWIIEVDKKYYTKEEIKGSGKNGKPVKYKKVKHTELKKNRAHAFYPEEVIEWDYTYLDKVLSEDPFNYGHNDKLMVEALYEVSGGDIYFKEWMNGDTLVGFDGKVIPGAGVPTEYMKYYLAAEKKYSVDWYYIAAIHFVETTFSTLNPMISSAGAVGHTQFMPCTWLGWGYPGCKGTMGDLKGVSDEIMFNPVNIKKYGGEGVDGNGDGIASPWDIEDALFATAKKLNKDGFSQNIDGAIFNYNRSNSYVEKVKKKAMEFKESAEYVPEDGTIPNLKPGSFMRPTIGKTSSGYGHRWGRLHAGMDITDASRPPVVAVADGEVLKANTGCPIIGNINSKCGFGWGNYVIVRHNVQGKIYDAVYAHFERVGVAAGQLVKQGQYLGKMGTSGSSTGLHLHFELHPGGRTGQGSSVNPAPYLPSS